MTPWVIVAALSTAATLWPVVGLETARGALTAAPWCLWTGPLRHADLGHLARDLAGLLTLAYMMRARLGRGRTAALIALGLPLPVLGALAGDPAAAGYYGVSGLAHALFAAAVVDLWTERRGWAAALGVALAVKLAFEVSSGALWVPLDGGRPAPWAHVSGALVGALIAVDHSPLKIWRHSTHRRISRMRPS